MSRLYLKMVYPAVLLALCALPAMGQVGPFEQEADWGNQGSVHVEGSASESGGTITIQGNGDDIWNQADEGFYVYTEKTGSWVVGGQFTWIAPGENDWSKVGPMIREEPTEVDSVNYYGAMRGALDLVSPQWRPEKGASSSSHGPRIRDENDELVAPEDSTIWLRATRIAEFDFVFVEWSRDGQNWTLGHSMSLPMAESVGYGIAITNHEDNEFLAEAEVSNAFLDEFDSTVAGRNFAADQVSTGNAVGVSLQIINPGEATITETLPDGWTASNISDGGSADGNVITWNVDASVSEVSYDATPGDSATGSTFSGDVDGFGTLGSSSITLLQSGVGDFENHADIGPVQVAGSARFENGTYFVQGGGNDIWNNADQFHFLFSEFEGPFRMSGEALSFPFESGSDWVKGGLMIRNNLTPGSSNGFIQVRTDLQMNSQGRPAQGESSVGVADLTEDQFGGMIIERRGKTIVFTRLDSAGEEQPMGSIELTDIQDPVFGGLAITSHENGSLSELEFNNLEIELLNLSADRRFSSTSPLQGNTITVTIGAFSRNTTEFTLTETPPAGWGISNVSTDAGSASESDGTITWDATGADGEVLLSYDLTVPEDAVDEDAVFDGEISAGGETASVVGPDLSLPFLVDTEQYPPQPFENGVAFSEAEDLPVIKLDESLDDPFEVIEDDRASGGLALSNFLDAGSEIVDAFAIFVLDVQEPGEYAFIGRTLTPTGTEDSFWIAVNGEPVADTDLHRWQGSGDQSDEYQQAWVAVDGEGPGTQQTWDLQAGTNFMVIHPREDGTVVDWIAATNRLDLDPATFDPDNIPPVTDVADFMLY